MDCEWGEEKVTIPDESNLTETFVLVQWNKAFVVINQQLTLLSDGRLQIDTHSHYIDESGRADKDMTDYFIKR